MYIYICKCICKYKYSHTPWLCIQETIAICSSLTMAICVDSKPLTPGLVADESIGQSARAGLDGSSMAGQGVPQSSPLPEKCSLWPNVYDVDL